MKHDVFTTDGLFLIVLYRLFKITCPCFIFPLGKFFCEVCLIIDAVLIEELVPSSLFYYILILSHFLKAEGGNVM